MAVVRQRVNLTSASIPGPQVPLYLAGAQVLEVFPVLPLIANEPLGWARSYAGAFSIGVVADRDAFPDLDVFTAGVRQALRALGVSTDPTPVHPGRTLRSLAQPATSDRLQAPATTVPMSPKTARHNRRRW